MVFPRLPVFSLFMLFDMAGVLYLFFYLNTLGCAPPNAALDMKLL